MSGIERSVRAFRSAVSIFVFLILLFTLFLAIDPVVDDDLVEDADAIRAIGSYIELNRNQTKSNQKGNVVELYTGPGETRYTDQIYGNVMIWRTSKVLRDRIMVNLYLESEDTSLVIGSVTPMAYDVDPVVYKRHTQGISINLRLASPMLQYSTGIESWVKVKLYGTWLAQWNLGMNGTWESGIIEPVYIYVHVVPYHYLQMSFDPAMVQLGPGGTGEIDVIVLNSGNGMERVDLTIPDELTYAREGWIFEFNRTTLNIPPYGEARARIKVTAPRSTVKWHMETKDFSVVATSYYDKYQAVDEDREPISYEMTFMAYIFGLDFTYIPWAWAALFYIIFFVITFNLGINPTTMRKRRLPRGQKAGFIKLYEIYTDPAKKRAHQLRKAEIKKLKEEDRARRKEERDKEREKRPPEREKAKEILPKPKAKVLDLKRVDDDFDLIMPEEKPRKKMVFSQAPAKKSDDDFDIMIDAPKKKERSARKPLFERKKPEAPSRSENDFANALDDL